MKSLILSACLIFFPLTLTAGEDRQILSPVMLIDQSCETGTLLFSQGDCLAVRVYTNSPYTHVAMVIEEKQVKYVYDSMNGVGVRKQTLSDYLTIQCPDKVHLYQPKRPFTEAEATCLQAYLDSQLDRPYAVAHHLTGKRSEGLHCSEYVTDALIEVDWLRAKKPPRVSPASLAKGVELHGVYASAMTVELPYEIEPIPEPATRCGKLWLGTKLCVGRSCGQMSRWFLCR